MKTKVDLITGFLGAGKTTFILRYAEWLQARGIKMAIIENEFGLAGCDGAVLREFGLSVAELSGGCICCSLKVDFANMLAKLSGKVARIIVEPSGIFTPVDFFAVMNSPAVRRAAEVGFVAAIADSAGTDGLTEEAAAVWTAQMNAAGIVILSRTDGMSEDDIDAVVMRLHDSAPAMEKQIMTKPWPMWDDEDFSTVIRSGAETTGLSSALLVNHATIFNSATLAPKRLYTKAELTRRLESIMADADSGVILRIKGAVQAEGGGQLSVNVTPSGVSVLPLREAAMASMVNIIGRGIERKRIRTLLEE